MKRQNHQVYHQNDLNKVPQIHKTGNENEDITADINVVDTHLKNFNSNNLENSKRNGRVLRFIWLAKVKWKLNKQPKQIYSKQ